MEKLIDSFMVNKFTVFSPHTIATTNNLAVIICILDESKDNLNGFALEKDGLIMKGTYLQELVEKYDMPMLQEVINNFFFKDKSQPLNN